MFENINLHSGTSGTISSGTTTGTYTATPIVTTLPFSVNTAISHSLYTDSNNSTINNNMNKVSNQFVAVFKIERNDKNEITSAKFIKELWIETKNGSSVDFEVAKDKDISKYEANEIAIRTIYTVTF
jgi:hypothetical protein